MPGFVDVSNMSDLEIKRLGQMDDEDEPTPQRRGRRSYSQPVGTKYTAADVWAAAAAAHRVNDGYVKEETYRYDEATNTRVLLKRRNRDLVAEFLAQPNTILPQDREQGQTVRDFLQKDLTFRGLKGRLTDFDVATGRCLALAEFHTVQHRYELAVVACLPNSAAKQQVRQSTDERIKFATGGLIGQPNDKVTVNLEVLTSTWSANYGIYWIRGITDQDQPVFFSNKQSYDAGTHLTVRGTVKAHKDNFTQLNRVKVL